MKFVILLAASMSLAALASAQEASNVICYYDSASYMRQGLSKLTTTDLQPALQFCSHLIYGYAGIDPISGNIGSNDPKLDLDLFTRLYRKVTDFKKKFPQLKVLLSVGGDNDKVDPDNNQYLTLLGRTNASMRFINTTYELLEGYDFDGLDLAWQFPKTGSFVVDEKAEKYKEQFTTLARELKKALSQGGFMLGLSVLPNVNSSLFYDVPAIVDNLDYVNLHAYDFQTPERNPEVADYPAPIYELNERNPEFNVNYQVQYWLNNHCPATKINVGIAAYGRAWKMTKDSGLTGLPPVSNTDGVAPAGIQTKKAGFLSWAEVCSKLPNPGPLRMVDDPTKRFGKYGYRSADDNGEHGMWVGYEDPDMAARKATFAKSLGLGGIALVDLSFDDFRGSCTGEKFPILHAIKLNL